MAAAVDYSTFPHDAIPLFIQVCPKGPEADGLVDVLIEPLDLAKLQLVPHGGPLPLFPETVLVIVERQVVSTLSIEGILYSHWTRLVIIQQHTTSNSLLNMNACIEGCLLLKCILQ